VPKIRDLLPFVLTLLDELIDRRNLVPACLEPFSASP